MATDYFHLLSGQSNGNLGAIVAADLATNYLGYNLKVPYIVAWKASQSWAVGDIRHANGNEYECITGGAGATSGIGPNTTDADIPDGAAAHWKYLRPALADIPTWAATTAYVIGDVVVTTAGRFYICNTAGTSGSTEPTYQTNMTSPQADGAGSLRWLYKGTDTTALAKKNPIFNSVKIWDSTAPGWQKMSHSNVLINSTNLGLGPQLAITAQLLSRFDVADHGNLYIVKHAVAATTLAHVSANTWAWGAETYDSAPTRSLLKLFLDNVCNAAQNRFTAGADDVKIIAHYDHQGEDDSQNTTYAYNYRQNKQNWFARRNERLALSTANAPFTGLLYPAIPRNNNTNDYYNQLAVEVRRAIDYVVAKCTAASGRAAVIDNESLYTSALVDADTIHWNATGIEQNVSAFFTAFDTARGATSAAAYSATLGKTGSPGSYTLVQDTSFAALPSITQVTAPVASVAPNVALTAEVTAADGGAVTSSVSWYDDDGDTFQAGADLAGGTFSATPAKYHGHCIRARYENASFYCAEKYWFTHVLAPSNAITDPAGDASIAPKQWMRAGVGATVAADGNVSAVTHGAGATASAAWQQTTVYKPMQTHRGLAFQANDSLETVTADDVSVTGDYTRIFKGRIFYAKSVDQCVYGSHSITANYGTQIGVYAADSKTDIRIAAYRGNGVIVGTIGTNGTADLGSANDDVIVAITRSGTTITTHWWNGSSRSSAAGVAYTPTAHATPDRIGALSVNGFEGLAEHAIAYSVALSNAQLEAAFSQLAANDVPVAISASQSATLAPVTQTATATATAGLSQSATIGPVVHASEIAWIELRDAAGNRTVSSVPVQRAAVSVSDAPIIISLSQSANIADITQAASVVVRDNLVMSQNAALPDITQSATAGVQVAGQQSATLDPVAQSASATTAASMAQAATLDAVTQAATVASAVAASQGVLIDPVTQSAAATVGSATASMSQNATIGPVVHASEIAWIELRDASGNRAVSSVPVQRAAVTVSDAPVVISAAQNVTLGAITQSASVVTESVTPASLTQSATLAPVTQSAAVYTFGGLGTVTLVDPLYTGPGSILDASQWQGAPPAAGHQVWYETHDGLLVYANGSYSTTAGSGAWNIWYWDGVDYYNGQLIVDPVIQLSQAVTLAAVTQVAAIVSVSTAAQSVTLAAVEQTASATVANAAAQNATIDPVVQAATAATAVQASQSATLDPVAQVGTAAVSDFGTAILSQSATIDPVTQASAAVVSIAAAQAATLEPVTQIATASISVAGSQSATLAEVIQISTAAARVAAAQNASIGAVTQAAAASVVEAGAISASQNVTLAPVIQLAEARAQIQAQQNSQIGEVTQYATAQLDNGSTTAEQSATLAPVVQLATAAAYVTAQQNATIGPVTQNAYAMTNPLDSGGDWPTTYLTYRLPVTRLKNVA